MNDSFRPRTIFWFSILLMIPALFMFVYHLVGSVLGNAPISTLPSDIPIVNLIIELVVAPTTVVVGLWCLRRAPGNVVGVMLVLWGIGVIDYIRSDPSPLGAGFSSLYAAIRWSALFSIVVYFPDGKVVPHRFQKWIDGLIIIAIIAGVLQGFAGQLAPNRDVANPLYIPPLAPLYRLFEFMNGAIMMAIGILFGIVSQVIRYRRADTHQRQQMKWLLLFFVPIVLGIPLQGSIDMIAPSYSAVVSKLIGTFILIWFMAFPVIAVGNAILRHKLYDIDIIIRRTLIYSILTVSLAALYFGGVVLAQSILRPLTASSNLAIVLSTLGIAALFNPLRHRIQNVIDRHFFRRKYDAKRTLEAFSLAVRDEVDWIPCKRR